MKKEGATSTTLHHNNIVCHLRLFLHPPALRRKLNHARYWIFFTTLATFPPRFISHRRRSATTPRPPHKPACESHRKHRQHERDFIAEEIEKPAGPSPRTLVLLLRWTAGSDYGADIEHCDFDSEYDDEIELGLDCC